MEEKKVSILRSLLQEKHSIFQVSRILYQINLLYPTRLLGEIKINILTKTISSYFSTKAVKASLLSLMDPIKNITGTDNVSWINLQFNLETWIYTRIIKSAGTNKQPMPTIPLSVTNTSLQPLAFSSNSCNFRARWITYRKICMYNTCSEKSALLLILQ